MRRDVQYYQLQNSLGATPDKPLLYVRVIVVPSLIRNEMIPTLKQNADIAIISVIGAVFLTLLFSTLAFRPLGHIGHMLDMVARGEFESENLASDKTATDELSVMASKVSLLGQRLRGAQFEVSDLRGNIDRLLEDLEDAVLIFNRENRLIFASGSVTRLLGKERATLSGETIAEIFPP